MATVNVQVDGLDDVLRNVRAYGERVRRDAERIVAKYALLIERQMKADVAVDSGALRDSIYHVLEGMAARVIAGQGLPDARAIFVEFGTYKMAAQPYAVNALEMFKAAFVAELRAAMGGTV